MDNIQKYLRDNRASFDTDIPDEENWIRLSRRFSEVDQARRMRGRRLFRLGMAASLLLAAAGFVLWRMDGTSIRRPPVQETSVGSSGTVPQAEVVSNTYSPIVLRELADLEHTSFYGNDRSVFKVFSLQWKTLDANEKAIEKNIRSVGPTDRLIQQLTDNYELKIRLLQQFSMEIKKVKHYLPATDTLVKIPSLSLLSIKTSNDEKQ